MSARRMGTAWQARNAWVSNPSWMMIPNGDSELNSSSDGQSWVDMPLPTNFSIAYDIEYGNGLWVLVGINGSSVPIISTSSNGVDWTEVDLSGITFSSNILSKINYSNEIGRFMAFTKSEAIYSDDGTTWTRSSGLTITSDTHGSYARGVWTVGHNTAVDGQSVAYSSDNGVNWSYLDDNMTSRSGQGLFANGKWLVIGDGATPTIATASSYLGAYSQVSPGIAFTTQGDTVYGNGVILIPGDSSTMARSADDGATWATELPGSSTCAVEFGDGLWVSGTTGAGSLSSHYSTDDGLTWTV